MKKNFIFIALFTLLLAKEHPYTILISFDGFRWDYLHRGLTPNIDTLQQNGISAISLKPSYPSITFPNHISIISGKYPENHNIIANFFYNPSKKKKYAIYDTIEVRNPEWYNCEAFWQTANKNGIKTASYFWPYSDVNDKAKRPFIYKKYEHLFPYEKRIDSIISWLQLPSNIRPKFITLYFDATDTYGHKYGPKSAKIDSVIQKLDFLTGILIKKLRKINLYDSTNIILVSDHGMAEIKGVINISNTLKKYDYEKIASGTFFTLKSKDYKKIYNELKKNENNYKIFLKNEIPYWLNFKNAKYLGDILIIPEIGYIITDVMDEYEAKLKASHGWDNNNIEMHGIFVACGPSFKNNYHIGTVSNVDIYPMLCKIYNLKYNHKIDGKLENIEFILK